jgi:hypothetical protein
MLLHPPLVSKGVPIVSRSLLSDPGTKLHHIAKYTHYFSDSNNNVLNSAKTCPGLKSKALKNSWPS